MHFTSPFTMDTEEFIMMRFQNMPMEMKKLKEDEIEYLRKFDYLNYEFTINDQNLLTERFYHRNKKHGELILVHLLEDRERQIFTSYMFDVYCVLEHGNFFKNIKFEKTDVYEYMERVFSKDRHIELGKSFIADNCLVRDKNKKIDSVKIMFSNYGDYYVFTSTQTHVAKHDFGKNHYKKRAKLKEEQFKLISLFKERLKKERIRMLMNGELITV